MIDEIEEQLNGQKPACIVASVGGGGLLVGILQGMEKAGWIKWLTGSFAKILESQMHCWI